MGWRTVVISNSAKLDYQLGHMIVRQSETVRIHLDEISVLMIETTSVSITGALLSELIKKKIKVVFCDEKRNPSSELIPYYGSHDTSAKIRNQIKWPEYIKTAVWTEIVAEKIRNQARHLDYWEKKEATLLWQYVSEIQAGDKSNREGHAAKVYFNALFGLKFTRSEDNSINAVLNYGYSLILSVFSREITANGYLTQLGLYHDNMFNHFNLASDLMEPFRPVVDFEVVKLEPKAFGKDERRQMLLMLQDEVLISGRKETLINAIKIYCRSIFDALEQRDTGLIRFWQYEL